MTAAVLVCASADGHTSACPPVRRQEAYAGEGGPLVVLQAAPSSDRQLYKRRLNEVADRTGASSYRSLRHAQLPRHREGQGSTSWRVPKRGYPR